MKDPLSMQPINKTFEACPKKKEAAAKSTVGGEQ